MQPIVFHQFSAVVTLKVRTHSHIPVTSSQHVAKGPTLIINGHWCHFLILERAVIVYNIIVTLYTCSRYLAKKDVV